MSIRSMTQLMQARPVLQRWAARAKTGSQVGVAAQILNTQPSSLKGYYPCDDASTQLTDLSIHSNHLPEVGSGHTYSIAGYSGNAVNGNFTGGWNNSTSAGAFTPLQVGDNGMTMCAIVRPQGTAATHRLFGFGGTEGAWFECKQNASAANRTIETSGNNVSLNSIINVVTNHLPDTDWHFIGMTATVAGIGGPLGPDDLHVFLDTDTPTKIDDTTYRTTPFTHEIDDVWINALLFSNANQGDYGGWDLQHVAFWDATLTDDEIADIATAAGF